MSDYSELKTAATRIIEVQTSQDVPISKLFDEFDALASPEAVLAMIGEVEGFRAQHGRDSAELRSLCQARDDARKERDQLKADNEELRKDAERYRFLRQDISNNVQDFCIVKKRWSATFPGRILELDGADAEIDAAMTKGAKP